MDNTIIISTGGTFNKVYNKINGNLEIDLTNSALRSIQNRWFSSYKYINIINKDSLDFTNQDREELLNTIIKLDYKNIVIIHGTDTIDITAKYLDNANLNKTIILTGAMVPFSINPIEATANLSFAIAYCNIVNSGVYIALNGVADIYNRVIKNRELGKFELI